MVGFGKLKSVLLLVLISQISFASVQAKRIEIPITGNAQKITLTVIQLLPSHWPEDLVIKEIKKVNLIWGQCQELIQSQVQIGAIEFFKVKYNPLFSDELDGEKIAEQLSKLKVRQKKQATLVLMQGLGGDLKAIGGGAGGLSFNRKALEQEAQRENLSFIFERIQSSDYWKIRPAKYSPVAHELLHVFLNEGHAEGKNLMSSNVELINDRLTTSQCETLVRSPLVKELAN